MVLPALGLAALAIPVLLELHVEGSCPSLAQVRAELDSVAPLSPESTRRAEIIPDGDGVRVKLVRADGGVSGERRLPPASCLELARAVAVVLAAWQGRLEATPTLDRTPAKTPPSVAGLAPPAAAAGLDLQAEALGSWTGGSWAPGLQVSVSRGLRPGVRLETGALVVAPHAHVVGPGEAVWWRAGAAVALVLRRDFPETGPALELGAEALLTTLRVHGRGFAENSGATLLDPGLAARARLAWRRGPFGLWLGAALIGWPRAKGVYVGGTDAREEVPRLEFLLRAGASLAAP